MSRKAKRPPIFERLEARAAGLDSLYVSYFLDGLGIDWEELRFQKERLPETSGAPYAEIDFGGEPMTLDDVLTQLRPLTGLPHSPELWRADVQKIRKRELGL